MKQFEKIFAAFVVILMTLLIGSKSLYANPDLNNENLKLDFYDLLQQKKDPLNDPNYLKWRSDYEKAEASFKKWKKFIYIGQAAFGVGVLINVLTSLTAREDVLTGVIIGSSVALGGVGLWLYSANRRGAAKEKMELLMNEGRIKKYIGAFVNPREKSMGVTFRLAF